MQGISDLITITGEINLDFADVRTIMQGMGMALMGTGIASGDDRAVEAAQRAISSPLLEDASINGARGVLINITGGPDMTLHEVAEASTIIHESADPEANIIFGTVIDEALGDSIKITVIATGFEGGQGAKHRDAVQIEEPAPVMKAKPKSPAPGPTSEPPPTMTLESDNAQQNRVLRSYRGPSKVGNDEGGYGPHYKGVREDILDVPTFIRKQMD